MGIRLDHVIVPSHDPVVSARHLAELLDVPWEESRGSFTPVHVNDTLTFDFALRETFERHHYCFHVSDAEFDAIFGRIAERQIRYRSRPNGDVDMTINRRLGGKNLYWEDPDGHLWEMLTISYARGNSVELATTG